MRFKIFKGVKDKKTLLTDGPSIRTHLKSRSRPSNVYSKLISKKERLTNENSSITYILNRRFPNL